MDDKALEVVRLKMLCEGLRERVDSLEGSSIATQFASFSASADARLEHIENILSGLDEVREQVAGLNRDQEARKAAAVTMRWAVGLSFTALTVFGGALARSAFGAIHDRLDQIEAQIEILSAR